MKSFAAIFSAALLMLVVTSSQEKRAFAGDVPAFDPQHQETVKGEVQLVNDYKCPVTGTIGTHLMIKTLTETIEAHLAPEEFMKEFGIVVKRGDQVVVTGTKVIFEGKPAILAKSIKINHDTFTFRDEKGRPLW